MTDTAVIATLLGLLGVVLFVGRAEAVRRDRNALRADLDKVNAQNEGLYALATDQGAKIREANHALGFATMRLAMADQIINGYARRVVALQDQLGLDKIDKAGSQWPDHQPGDLDMATLLNLPRYRCHKVVGAAKVIAVDLGVQPHGEGGEITRSVTVDLGGGATRSVQTLMNWPGWQQADAVGGYLVQYDDGYLSWSPAQAFEAGYAKVEG